MRSEGDGIKDVLILNTLHYYLNNSFQLPTISFEMVLSFKFDYDGELKCLILRIIKKEIRRCHHEEEP